MTTRLKGLTEPSRFVSNALRLGTVIRIMVPGRSRDAAMMISGIIRLDGDEHDNLYVLLTAHSRLAVATNEVRCELVRGQGRSRVALGALLPPERVLGADGAKLGFHVLRLENTPLFSDAKGVATTLAVVRDFRRSIWRQGSFKVRRLNDPLGTEAAGIGSNARPFLSNRKGRVGGDIDDVSISDYGRTLKYSYCGVVGRGRGRPLAGPKALGAPLISRSGALSAIIVGAIDSETLVYPIEEMLKNRPIGFVTLGHDWPKVRVEVEREPETRLGMADGRRLNEIIPIHAQLPKDATSD